MQKKSNPDFLLFTKPLKDRPNLKIEEGKYFNTRGGRIAKIIYVSKETKQCCAIHSPGTKFENGPIFHELETGYALPLFSLLTPPTYTGHPADLIEEVKPN